MTQHESLPQANRWVRKHVTYWNMQLLNAHTHIHTHWLYLIRTQNLVRESDNWNIKWQRCILAGPTSVMVEISMKEAFRDLTHTVTTATECLLSQQRILYLKHSVILFNSYAEQCNASESTRSTILFSWGMGQGRGDFDANVVSASYERQYTWIHMQIWWGGGQSGRARGTLGWEVWTHNTVDS